MMDFINYAFFYLILQLVLCESRFVPFFEKTEANQLVNVSMDVDSHVRISRNPYFKINQRQDWVPGSAESSEEEWETEEAEEEGKEEWETDRRCGIPSCRHRFRRKRVVGGTRVMYGQIPWLVSLRFRGEDPFFNRTGFNHFCGASLINSYWLLTAAHCFDDHGVSTKALWYAVIGGNSLAIEEKTEKRVEIAKIIVHENFTYGPDVRHDIALLKLSEPIKRTKHIKFICLDHECSITPGDKCTVAGWGLHSHEGAGSSYPFKATLNILPRSTCKKKVKVLPKYLQKYFLNYKTIFCADTEKGADACNGDSGGPFQCYRNGRWYLTGLVSSGIKCGIFPGIYTRVGCEIDWIKDQMKKN